MKSSGQGNRPDTGNADSLSWRRFNSRGAFKDASIAVNKLYSMPSRKGMTSGTFEEVPERSVIQDTGDEGDCMYWVRVPGKKDICIRIHATSVTASNRRVRSFRIPRWHPMGILMGP